MRISPNIALMYSLGLFYYSRRMILTNSSIQSNKLRKMTKIGLLSAISFVLFLIEFAIPIFPAFLKIDISDLPAIIASFAMGPLAGVLVEMFKNVIHLTITSTGGVGELANFIIGCAFVVPAGLIYKSHKKKKYVLLSLIAGIISMVIVAVLMNYFVLIPLYTKFMPLDTIINMAAAVNPYVDGMTSLMLYVIAPFNLIKGIILALITRLIYKKISHLLK